MVAMIFFTLAAIGSGQIGTWSSLAIPRYVLKPRAVPPMASSKKARSELIEGAKVKKDEILLEIEPFAPDELNQIQSQVANLRPNAMPPKSR